MHNDNDYVVYQQPQAYYNQDTGFSESRQGIELEDLNGSFTHVGMKFANETIEQKNQKGITADTYKELYEYTDKEKTVTLESIQNYAPSFYVRSLPLILNRVNPYI